MNLPPSEALPVPDKPVVVLIGNYPIDRQESMIRFKDLLHARLTALGYATESVLPCAYLGRVVQKGPAGKWLGYVDKYILFPFGLAAKLAGIKRKYPGRKIVVHICDHSNSVYAALARRRFPVLVTCHDLIAVRGSLGEEGMYCPVSRVGKYLQAAILRGIGQANAVACVSQATQSDLIRLSGPALAKRSRVVPLALNYPFRALPREEAMDVLARAQIELPYQGYVLHVGSGLLRKNRKALLRSVAEIKGSWSGLVVFAGERLTPEEQALADSLGLRDRVREIPRPSNETLVALYSAAHGLIFMSYAEGFGWPILEAQACGCPVICSDCTSVPEVAGKAGLVHGPEDYAAVGREIERLQDSAFRDSVVALGFANAQNYSVERMMKAYEEIYGRSTS